MPSPIRPSPSTADAALDASYDSVVAGLAEERRQALMGGRLQAWHAELRQELLDSLQAAGLSPEQAGHAVDDAVEGQSRPGGRIEGLACTVRLAKVTGDLDALAKHYLEKGAPS